MVPRTALSVVAALALGLGAGLACGGAPRGSRLPRAGSDDDDGMGLLARASRGQRPRPGSVIDSDRSQSAWGGEPMVDEGFGGDWYGGGAYGGAIYGLSVPPPYSPPPQPIAGSYAVTDVVEAGTGGTIEGQVLWKGARAPAQLPAVAGTTRCAGPLENRSLVVAPGGGLRGAVVYLAEIRSGKPAPMPNGATLDVDECRFAPDVQLAAPIGVVLTVTNQATAPGAVRIVRSGERGGSELALGPRGLADVLLDRDGIWEATVPGGHPAASATVVVPAHPYYALTDAEGRFRLDDVPAGEYVLVAWHAPVTTGLDSQGQVVRVSPVEIKTKVKVEGRRTVSTRLELR